MCWPALPFFYGLGNWGLEGFWFELSWVPKYLLISKADRFWDVVILGWLSSCFLVRGWWCISHLQMNDLEWITFLFCSTSLWVQERHWTWQLPVSEFIVFLNWPVRIAVLPSVIYLYPSGQPPYQPLTQKRFLIDVCMVLGSVLNAVFQLQKKKGRWVQESWTMQFRETFQSRPPDARGTVGSWYRARQRGWELGKWTASKLVSSFFPLRNKGVSH